MYCNNNVEQHTFATPYAHVLEEGYASINDWIHHGDRVVGLGVAAQDGVESAANTGHTHTPLISTTLPASPPTVPFKMTRLKTFQPCNSLFL